MPLKKHRSWIDFSVTTLDIKVSSQSKSEFCPEFRRWFLYIAIFLEGWRRLDSDKPQITLRVLFIPLNTKCSILTGNPVGPDNQWALQLQSGSPGNSNGRGRNQTLSMKESYLPSVHETVMTEIGHCFWYKEDREARFIWGGGGVSGSSGAKRKNWWW